MGAKVETDVHTYCSNHPVDREMFEEFTRLLDFSESSGRRLSVRSKRQVQRMEERGDLLLALTQRLRKPLSPSAGLWTAMSDVINAAWSCGAAFELAESGIVYVAVRNAPGDDALTMHEDVLQRIQKTGLTQPYHVFGSSGHLIEKAHAAAMIAPILLWNISLRDRVALLSGGMSFGCIYDPNVWSAAFQDHDIRLTLSDGRWILERGEDTLYADPVEVRKLSLGVAFGAFSPKQIAESISRAFVSADEKGALD